jgi:peptidoglycan/xylan/chitin deacetylase (PgdA/CDA1 family)
MRRTRSLILGGALTGAALLGIIAISLALRSGPTATPLVTATIRASAAPSATATPTPTPLPSLSPTPSPSPQPTPLGNSVTLPFLYMHQVVAIPPDIVTWSAADRSWFVHQTVTVCAFDAQLNWLERRGYHAILPRDLAAAWAGGPPLPPSPIILSFDDGSPDWYTTIFPMLLAHGFVAEFYTTLEHIGPALTWEQLAAMAAAGMGIGGHDVNHRQLTGATASFSPDQMAYQVAHVKEAIESHLGITVDSMAYVGGGYDAALMEIVRQAGYTTARSINRGVIQTLDRRFRLRVSRIGIYDDVVGQTLLNAIGCVLDPSMATFEARISGTDPG